MTRYEPLALHSVILYCIAPHQIALLGFIFHLLTSNLGDEWHVESWGFPFFFNAGARTSPLPWPAAGIGVLQYACKSRLHFSVCVPNLRISIILITHCFRIQTYSSPHFGTTNSPEQIESQRISKASLLHFISASNFDPILFIACMHTSIDRQIDS